MALFKLEQPTMSLQTQPFTEPFALTQDVVSWYKKSQTVAEGVAAAFDMEVEVELKQGGYLPVKTIQPWRVN